MTRTHPLFVTKKDPIPSGSQGPSKLETGPKKLQIGRSGYQGTTSQAPEVPEYSNGRWNSDRRWAYPSTSSTVRKPPGKRDLLKTVYDKEHSGQPPLQHIELQRIKVTAPIAKVEATNQSCCSRFSTQIGKARKEMCRCWKLLKKKKREWDKWNPNKLHPIAACIDESKLAGLKETIKPNRGILYRIMWLLVFVTALGVATKMVYNTNKFHKETPVLYAFETKEVNIENLAAPTITVCPSAAFKASSLAEASVEYLKLSHESVKSKMKLEIISKQLYFMRNACETKTLQSSRHALGHLNPLRKVLSDRNLAKSRLKDTDDKYLLTKHVIPSLKKASHNCAEMLKFCSWNMKISDMCEAFTSSFETTGGCCSFNNLPDSELYKRKKSLKVLWSKREDVKQKNIWKGWTLQKHLRDIHDTNYNKSAGPLRQADGGWPWGLSFVVIMDDQDSDCPQFDSSGTRISISVPGVDVDVERENIIIPPNHEVFIKIFPELTLADEDLRTISPVVRGCYMENEKHLIHYNMYNQENCHRECVADLILKTCGCVLLSFPNSEGQEICNIDDLDCVREEEGNIVRDIGLLNACPTCLPTCSHMSLRLETTMSPYSKHHMPEMTKSINKTTSLVHTFYGPKSVTAKVRKLRHSKYELYSEAGSIYETTNDMSLMGYVRIICGSTAFIPTIIGIVLLLRAYCFRCPVVCRKLNIRTFGLRRRLQVHPAAGRLNKLTQPVTRADDEAQVDSFQIINEITTPKNFDVFLAQRESPHVAIQMPPSPSHP